MKNNFIFTPDWLSGFTQTDGSFTVSFEKRNKGILYRPSPVFSLAQTNLEYNMFISLQKHLGIGSVYKNRNEVIFVVKTIEDLVSVILPLFDKSPLRGGKLESYLKFRDVVLLMKDKKHLNIEGLLQIIEVSYFMNKDTTLRTNLSKSIILNELKDKYGTLPFIEDSAPRYKELKLVHTLCGAHPINLEYIRGLVDGDGSFNVAFRTDSRKIGLNFTIVQEISSISILYELISFFNCGHVYKLPSEAARYQVQSKKELLNNVIPMFRGAQNFKLNTRKQENLEIFIKVCEILNSSWFKDEKSLEKIVHMAWDMNTGSSLRRISKEEYLSKFITSSKC